MKLATKLLGFALVAITTVAVAGKRDPRAVDIRIELKSYCQNFPCLGGSGTFRGFGALADRGEATGDLAEVRLDGQDGSFTILVDDLEVVGVETRGRSDSTVIRTYVGTFEIAAGTGAYAGVGAAGVLAVTYVSKLSRKGVYTDQWTFELDGSLTGG